LTDRRTGERRRFTTFSDGDFYVLSVKPACIDLTVEAGVLAALGASAQPVHLTLAPTGPGGELGVSGLELLLTPKP